MRRFSRSAKTYGFELPPPPQVAPADAGQGELFGDEFSQPDMSACSAQANAADGEPVFRPDAADRRSPKPPPGPTPAKSSFLSAAIERTGGEPDLVGHDKGTGAYTFFDGATQSPAGRQSLCYDRVALDGREKFPPKCWIAELAAAMGAELLDEAQYLALQQLGEFDAKTSSWIKTPADIRQLGGALYGDRRHHRVFSGHNGAESYYRGRGFRCWLRV